MPVLAGSAAYAVGEARKWPVGLARKPKQAKAFYITITVATIIGALINFLITLLGGGGGFVAARGARTAA